MTFSQPVILVADDDDDIRLALDMLLSSQGYAVLQASTINQVHKQLRARSPNLILLDMNFSRDTTSGCEGLQLLEQLAQTTCPIILMTAWGSVELAVEGLKLGAKDFFEKPWNKDKLLNSIKHQLQFSELQQHNEGLQHLLSTTADSSATAQGWVCASKAMQDIETMVSQIAGTDANVLILGENGTGKSLLAERIHALSNRASKPFVATNMAAIPDNLFESELFGHNKGAFTDAKQQRIGRFQLADCGTLFFDEIGTLPFHLQAKLLRVLESGEFEPLGSSQTKRTNVRMISATNADLGVLVNQQKFRQDLLYRLNTIVITMPPLRQRHEDMPALVSLFLGQYCRRYNKPSMKLNQNAMQRLHTHTWPGNIRELGHVIERAVLMSSTPEIGLDAILLEGTQTDPEVVIQPLEQAEKQLIEATLLKCNGNVAKAAKILEISRNALYRRLEKHKVELVAD